jgi:hypothetical protein
MKAKKEYRRPMMKVVMLRHAGMLMASGDGKGLTSPSDYADGGDPFAEPSGE